MMLDLHLKELLIPDRDIDHGYVVKGTDLVVAFHPEQTEIIDFSDDSVYKTSLNREQIEAMTLRELLDTVDYDWGPTSS